GPWLRARYQCSKRQHGRPVWLWHGWRRGPLCRRSVLSRTLLRRVLQPLLQPSVRLWSWLGLGQRLLLGLERSVLVFRRHRQLCRVSQPDRSSHSPGRHKCSIVRRTGTGALGDEPPGCRDPEPGRRDVYRFPGAERRNGKNHHTDAAAPERLGKIRFKELRGPPEAYPAGLI